jgi:hypothetical protein
LALALQPGHKPTGLYLVNVATGSTHLVQKGDFGGATWITNRELVASIGVSSDLPGGGAGPVGLERVELPNLG